jgi:hypothetical protein
VLDLKRTAIRLATFVVMAAVVILLFGTLAHPGPP